MYRKPIRDHMWKARYGYVKKSFYAAASDIKMIRGVNSCVTPFELRTSLFPSALVQDLVCSPISAAYTPFLVQPQGNDGQSTSAIVKYSTMVAIGLVQRGSPTVILSTWKTTNYGYFVSQ